MRERCVFGAGLNCGRNVTEDSGKKLGRLRAVKDAARTVCEDAETSLGRRVEVAEIKTRVERMAAEQISGRAAKNAGKTSREQRGGRQKNSSRAVRENAENKSWARTEDGKPNLGQSGKKC